MFGILGIALVVGISLLNGNAGAASMDLRHFSLGLGIKLFFIGMVAISAMFLPGISGSTLLLIFGAYIPVITAIRGVLGLNLLYVPCRLRYPGRGGNGGRNAVPEGCFFRQEECFAFTVNYIRSK